MDEVKKPWGTVIGLICVLILVATWYSLRSPDDPGPYSALTRSQLRAVSDPGDLLVPVHLPPGLNEAATTSDFVGSYEVRGESFMGDEVAFFLTRVQTANNLPTHRREVVAQYQSVVLDRSGRARYEVHQLPEGMRIANPCGRSDVAPIERSWGATRLIVCSSDLDPGSDAWSYWSSVPFTNDLESVDWLRGDAS